MTNFCKVFKQARLEKHYTQEKIAEELDVSPRWIQYIESGKKTPRLDLFWRIIKLLSIDPTIFLDQNK